jgi:hypothetical protein
VPGAGNPQALNRYSYVGNRPTVYVDPTGHAPQGPRDPDDMAGDCGTEWCWQNRWYRAHGYSWNGSGWGGAGYEPDPYFYDEGIADDVLTEAGITLASSNGWQREQKYSVARGAAMFGRKLGGGLMHLQKLLGGITTVWLQTWSPIACGLHQSPCAPPPPWDTGNNVYLTHAAMANYGANAHMLVVHELAHVIDWHSSIGGRSFSQAWPHEPITAYARDGWPPPWDRFAEAVAVWVFGDAYRSVQYFLITNYSAQMTLMADLLDGGW